MKPVSPVSGLLQLREISPQPGEADQTSIATLARLIPNCLILSDALNHNSERCALRIAAESVAGVVGLGDQLMRREAHISE